MFLSISEDSSTASYLLITPQTPDFFLLLTLCGKVLFHILFLEALLYNTQSKNIIKCCNFFPDSKGPWSNRNLKISSKAVCFRPLYLTVKGTSCFQTLCLSYFLTPQLLSQLAIAFLNSVITGRKSIVRPPMILPLLVIHWQFSRKCHHGRGHHKKSYKGRAFSCDYSSFDQLNKLYLF